MPVNASTPITVTLTEDLLQPIAGTGTVTFTADLGAVPATVEMVDGVAIATLDAGGVPGETVVVATLSEMTGRVRIQIAANDGRIADASPDQQVDPGTTVTLDGSGSSDPNGRPLWHQWVQVGGVDVDFSPTLSATTLVAPSGMFTFTLTVRNSAGMADTDTTVVTVTSSRIYLPLILKGGPQAQLVPDQGATSLFAGSEIVPAYIRNRDNRLRRTTRPWWWT